MEALIDGDLVCYRCASSCEEEETPHIAFSRMNELIERILARVTADTFTIYLSGGSNFRKEIDPQYKANRTAPKPKWLEACREHLVIHWNAVVTDGIEADDALGIAQREDTTICSLDKDLLQIPGKHYQWDISGKTKSGPWSKPEQFYDISPEEGLKRFWTQMLVGDTADNVVGIYGLGPKKTEKIFEEIQFEYDREIHDLEDLDQMFYNLVAGLYNDPIRMHRNAKLLWIMRNEGQIWQSPEERIKHDEEKASRVDRGPEEELYNKCFEGGQQEVAC